ncbi:DUF4431 domain-containing protein [Caenimonas terrae]|uniref:DUF4431 domain-containing protein n=1 Tax=Caenimonas terrae TaxID=696074 RepID=A0ABW0N9Q1_9BURK
MSDSCPDLSALPPDARTSVRRLRVARGRALALVLGIAGLLAATPAAAECFRYGPAPVTMTGILERHTEPERPGGGAPQTDYFLRLRSAVCAVAGPSDAPGAQARKGVWLVQLVPRAGAPDTLAPRLEHTVRVRGRLLSSSTERHHAPLLLEVEGLDEGG